MIPAYVYRAVCHRVIDGDTYELDIDLGFKVHVVIPVRLRGWNCPELRTPDGDRARAFAVGLLFEGMDTDSPVPVPLIVESFKGRRTFERWVCDVWLPDGSQLGVALQNAGLAVPA